MTSIAERLRQGVDPDDIQETESSMDIGAAEIERLRADNRTLRNFLKGIQASVNMALSDEQKAREK